MIAIYLPLWTVPVLGVVLFWGFGTLGEVIRRWWNR